MTVTDGAEGTSDSESTFSLPRGLCFAVAALPLIGRGFFKGNQRQCYLGASPLILIMLPRPPLPLLHAYNPTEIKSHKEMEMIWAMRKQSSPELHYSSFI